MGKRSGQKMDENSEKESDQKNLSTDSFSILSITFGIFGDFQAISVSLGHFRWHSASFGGVRT